MSPSTLTVSSLRALYQLWAKPQPAQDPTAVVQAWQAQTSEAVHAARQELDNHWSVRFSWHLTGGVGAVGLLLAVVASWLFPPLNPAVPPTYCIALWAVFGGVAGLLLGDLLVGPWLQAKRPTLRHLLEPASREPFLCRSAADFADSEPTVRRYRDETVESGRALTVADVYWMLELGYKAKAANEAETLRQNCLRLHGLAA